MSRREASSKAARNAVVAAARQLRRRQTPSERKLWEALRDRRFDGKKFRRQARIGHFVVDFYCPSEHLVVEVDGPVHMSQLSADKDRQELLEALDLRVLRVGSADVEQDLAGVLSRVADAFAPSPPAPLPRRGRGVAGGRGEGGGTPL